MDKVHFHLKQLKTCYKQTLIYGKHPKISNTKVSDKMAYVNSADPDQTAQEQSDQGLNCLPFH